MNLKTWLQRSDPTTLTLFANLGRFAGRLGSKAFYALCFSIAALLSIIFFRLRASGRHNVPHRGGLLVACNHQSFLDPIVAGLTVGRPLRCPARSTLFRWAPFRWAIETLGAIKIEREGVAKEGLRQIVDILQSGGCVAIWPEGTRTSDGHVGVLKPGVLLAIRRTSAPIVVCGIAGAFECWPRQSLLPRPGTIWVHYETVQLRAGSNDQQLSQLSSALKRSAAIAGENRRLALRKPLVKKKPAAAKNRAAGQQFAMPGMSPMLG